MNATLIFLTFAVVVWLLPAIVGAIMYIRLKEGKEGE